MEAANKEKSHSLLESGRGHDLTVEDLLFRITIALVGNRNEVQVKSVTKASGTAFQVTLRQPMWERLSEETDGYVD